VRLRMKRAHSALCRPQDNAWNYDKGVLAEILEPIMGTGLIPADLETWKPRRRAIVPAFHKAYLEAMVAMFGACTQETVRKLERAADSLQASMREFLPGLRHNKCNGRRMERLITACGSALISL